MVNKSSVISHMSYVPCQREATKAWLVVSNYFLETGDKDENQFVYHVKYSQRSFHLRNSILQVVSG